MHHKQLDGKPWIYECEKKGKKLSRESMDILQFWILIIQRLMPFL